MSNLASKYLYQAWYDIQASLGSSATVALYACARDSYSTGQPRLAATITRVVTCGHSAHGDALPCPASSLASFLSNITYVSLSQPQSNPWASPDRRSDAFSSLLHKLDSDAASPDTHLLSRVLFMSVAPPLYAPLLSNLTRAGLRFSQGAPAAHSGGDETGVSSATRVVLEKPIGHDQPSAEALLMGLSVHAGVPPSDTLIMDHYLAKTGVRAAAQLRSVMMDSDDGRWRAMLDSVLHASVVVMERETAVTRTVTYNDLGVVRDVMQNHMSVMFAATRSEAWDAPSRMAVYSRINFHASMMAQMEGSEASMMAGLSPSHTLQRRGRVSKERMSHSPALLTSAFRARVYDGYAEEVAAERLAADPRNSTFQGLEYVWSAMPGCSAMTRLNPRSFSSDGGGTRVPTPSQMLGPAYVAPTAASATGMFERGSVTFVAGKALDTRAAYVTEYFPSDESTCGPVTLTYHVQGLLQLPAGIQLRPNSPVRAVWPTDGAALLFTGTCVMPDVHRLFRAWPARGWAWDIIHDAVAHVVLAIPTITPVRAESGGDATARVLAALAAGASTPGATGRAAYTAVLMAAASEEPHALFVTPDEVRTLWRIFHQVSDACDYSLTQRCPGDAAKTYAVGDRSWLPLPVTPRLDVAQSLDALSWPAVASALVSAVWDVIRQQEAPRSVHVGLCYDISMLGLLDALAEAPVIINTPWPRMQLWMVASEGHNAAVREALLTRLYVDNASLHGMHDRDTADSMSEQLRDTGGALDVVFLSSSCLQRIVDEESVDGALFASAEGNAPTSWSVTPLALRDAAAVLVALPPSSASVSVAADGSSIEDTAPMDAAAIERALGTRTGVVKLLPLAPADADEAPMIR